MPAEIGSDAPARYPSAMAAQTRIYGRLDSTNLEAKRLIDAGESGPFWLLAHEQNAGQGRRNRIWQTGSGNFAATWAGYLQAPPLMRAQMGFALALAARDALENLSRPDQLRFKWPNDILIGDAKMGGILLESGTNPSGDSWLIAGIGINLVSAPKLPDRRTICLRDALAENHAVPTAEVLLQHIQAAFDIWRSRLLDEGFARIRLAWLGCAYGIGAPARVQIGERWLSGRVKGLDEEGTLLLEPENGDAVRVSAGDVFFGREEEI